MIKYRPSLYIYSIYVYVEYLSKYPNNFIHCVALYACQRRHGHKDQLQEAEAENSHQQFIKIKPGKPGKAVPVALIFYK